MNTGTFSDASYNYSAIDVTGDSICDLSHGSFSAFGLETTLLVGPHAILIVSSSNFSSYPEFGNYSNVGMTHVLGTTLSVTAGQSFGGWATITDPVSCQGSLIASPSGWLNLTNGLSLAGTGIVNLGSGN